MNNKNLKSPLLCTAALILIAGQSGAALVSWGNPTDLTGAASDIVATTTVVEAVSYDNAGAANVTVGGIEFNTDSVGNIGNLSIIGGGPAPASGNYGAGVFWNRGGEIAPLMLGQAWGGTNTEGEGMRLTLDGLTVDQDYTIWLAVADTRAPNTRHMDLDGDYSTVELDYSDDAGQYIYGTFTADASGTQTIDLVKAGATEGQAQIGAYVLSLGAVPEPSTMALLGLGLLFSLRRKRR